MSVRPDSLPRSSTLWSLHRPGDFLDCHSAQSALPLREAVVRGLTFPGWVTALLALRNRLMRPFGLKTGAAPGTRAVGIFPICGETATEIVLGLDDRHLDFRIGLVRLDGRLCMSTWVHPHNAFGRAYLAFVMPFHILISRGAVARMAG